MLPLVLVDNPENLSLVSMASQHAVTLLGTLPSRSALDKLAASLDGVVKTPSQLGLLVNVNRSSFD
jgi:hypothetical protein